MLLVSFEAYIGFVYKSNDTTNLWLQVSHACSAALFVLLFVLWLPVLNSLLRRIRIKRWSRYQVINSKRIHRWLGYGLFVFTLGHGVGQIGYLTTLDIPFTEGFLGTEADLVRSMRTTMYEFVTEDESIELMDEWIEQGRSEEFFHEKIRPVLKEDCTKCHSRSSTQTYAIQSLPLVKYDDVVALSEKGVLSRQFRINASGTVMFFVFFLMTLFAFSPLRKRYHHCFQYMHKLGYACLPFLLLHIPQWYWLLPVMLLFICDRLLKRSHTFRECSAAIEKLDEKTLKIVIPANFKTKVAPGDFIYLRVPSISKRQWHPFSIVSYVDGILTLKVSICGDWTSKLAEQVSNEALLVDVNGPCFSPASHSSHSARRIFVAGGIGITPFWHWLTASTRTPSVFIWVIKDASRLYWLEPFLKGKNQSDIRIYITGEFNELPSYVSDHPLVRIYQGRPCWGTISSELSTDSVGDFYICGPKVMMKEAGVSFRANRWNVFKESF